MLRGRESLARLVGKRRRNIPRDELLLRISHSSSPVVDKEAPVPNGSSAGGTAVSVGKVWVECPVCGKSMRGDDYMVNSHLDLCLSKGKKRKLTQRTLIQLNFCTKSSFQNFSDDSIIQSESTTELERDGDDEIPSGVLVGHWQECEVALEPVLNFSNTEEYKKQVSETESKDIDCTVEDPRIISRPLSNNFNGNNLMECLSRALLETFIVGHKFRNETNLFQGATVYIQRDYENIKDQHALKVVCLDSGTDAMVGYLPRELAKYLSPFVDRFKLKLEGSVTSEFEDPAIIPIQLFCREIGENDEPEAADLERWTKLWEHVLQEVEHEKKHPPHMIKYQRNFHIMVQEVLDHHAHVLESHEKEFLRNFNTLSDDSQMIFIRLCSRKGPWFQISKISYAEVGDVQKAIEELKLAGYVCPFVLDAESSRSEIAEILDILTVPELKEILNMGVTSKKGVNGTRKDQLIVQLLTTLEERKSQLLPNAILEQTGTCIKISPASESILWRIQRLFFLNGEQDLSSFLLVDLGLVQYPTYMCTISRAIFQDRNALLAYEEAIAIAQIMDESIDDRNSELSMRCTYFSYEQLSYAPESPSFYSQFSASWVYSKVVTLGISVCERDRRYGDAVQLLKGLLEKIVCGGKRGYWYLRLSVNLEHMGRANESLSVAEEGTLDPWVRAGTKIALQRRVIRLGKPPRRWKTPSFAASISKKIKEVCIQGRPLNCETGLKNFYYGFDGTQCSVEQLALQYYGDEGGGWKGVHTETGIWLTIFGLLMWDVIFSDVPDVFQTRFQTAPLDLDMDSFYQSRQGLIESHLQSIQAGMAEEILITSWDRHFGTACRGVNWDRHCLPDLRAAVSCIGGHCLASLLRLLAQDYRSWSHGMPDLFLWRFRGGEMEGGEAKLVEVKGPRDRLSEQQRAWMLFLMDCGFDTEVCRVSETPP